MRGQCPGLSKKRKGHALIEFLPQLSNPGWKEGGDASTEQNQREPVSSCMAPLIKPPLDSLPPELQMRASGHRDQVRVQGERSSGQRSESGSIP